MASVVKWEDRSGDVRLDFSQRQLPNSEIEVCAKLFQKNINGQLVDTGINISEKNMSIEMENAHALMRGIPQRTFNLGRLNPQQKQAILGSLERRTIEVMRGFHNASLIIHALP